MTPSEIRQWKNPMVADIGDIDALMEHPIIETTPNAAVVVTMTINATLETIAKRLEQEESAT